MKINSHITVYQTLDTALDNLTYQSVGRGGMASIAGICVTLAVFSLLGEVSKIVRDLSFQNSHHELYHMFNGQKKYFGEVLGLIGKTVRLFTDSNEEDCIIKEIAFQLRIPPKNCRKQLRQEGVTAYFYNKETGIIQELVMSLKDRKSPFGFSTARHLSIGWIKQERFFSYYFKNEEKWNLDNVQAVFNGTHSKWEHYRSFSMKKNIAHCYGLLKQTLYQFTWELISINMKATQIAHKNLSKLFTKNSLSPVTPKILPISPLVRN